MSRGLSLKTMPAALGMGICILGLLVGDPEADASGGSSSREEFLKHYEEVHAPLALKHLPSIKRYVRNYVVTRPGVEEPGFDCITEIWFDNMEGLQSAMHFWKSEAGQVIRDDEGIFMDRGKLVTLLVEEKASK